MLSKGKRKVFSGGESCVLPIRQAQDMFFDCHFLTFHPEGFQSENKQQL